MRRALAPYGARREGARAFRAFPAVGGRFLRDFCAIRSIFGRIPREMQIVIQNDRISEIFAG